MEKHYRYFSYIMTDEVWKILQLIALLLNTESVAN